MGAERYPLSWPTGWMRVPASERRRAAFKTARHSTGGFPRLQSLSISDAIARLSRELRRLGAEPGSEVLSTNVLLRLDGWPRSEQREPADPGAAVYFRLHAKPTVLACDKWDRVADNIAAIAAHIEATRAVGRYGVGTLDQAMAGYQALPAQASAWWTVLEFEDRPASWGTVEARYFELVKRHHPDRGGSPDTMAKINAARDAARIDLQVAS